MRLLWTVANWKRTGPLEPSLDLAAAMAARGHDVAVAVGRAPPGVEDHAAAAAQRRGLRVVLPDARLSKHAFFLRDRGDVKRIAAWIAAERPDAVVTTLDNDHRLAVRAAGTVPVVRLWFSDGTPPDHARDREALRAARAVVVFGAAPAATLAALDVPPARVVTTDPPLDVAALRAAAPPREAARARWAPDRATFLVGIVARLQRHRRFDLLWDALERARRDVPGLRCLVVGRGTWQEQVARGPVAARGLADVVAFAGYLRGADYASALAALDAQVLLVPGTDPTCRALREGMVLGVPAVATRRGLLPSIVEDGTTGLLVDERPESLAAALVRLARDPDLRARTGAAAARHADRFAADRVAADLEKALATATGAGGGPTLVLEGSRIRDLASFYEEVTRALLGGRAWGRNLDAWNDVLRGGFGTPEGGFRLLWRDADASRRALGPTLFDQIVEIARAHGPGGAEAQDGVHLTLS